MCCVTFSILEKFINRSYGLYYNGFHIPLQRYMESIILLDSMFTQIRCQMQDGLGVASQERGYHLTDTHQCSLVEVEYQFNRYINTQNK